MAEIKDIQTDVNSQTATIQVKKSLPDDALKAKLDEFAKNNDHMANYKLVN